MSAYSQCPKCGFFAMECLRTHSHCWECNYSPEAVRHKIRQNVRDEAYSGINYNDNELRDDFDLIPDDDFVADEHSIRSKNF
jgi:hypothetical protein